MLRESYDRRYPEHWNSFEVTVDVALLDGSYAWLRNMAVSNFPAEERQRARQFGTFMYDPYRLPPLREDVVRISGQSLAEALQQENLSFWAFDIEFGLL